MAKKIVAEFYPKNKNEWRKWLEKNHESEESVWLILFKKNSATPNLSWSDAVDEAICFGWIDSVKNTIDHEKYKQYFSKRKPKSMWSKVNKKKVELLLANNLIAEAGLKSIALAKQNGSWHLLDDIDNLVIPAELEQEFSTEPITKTYFNGLSKSAQKLLLYGITFAKTPETKQKRIKKITEEALNQKS